MHPGTVFFCICIYFKICHAVKNLDSITCKVSESGYSVIIMYVVVDNRLVVQIEQSGWCVSGLLL